MINDVVLDVFIYTGINYVIVIYLFSYDTNMYQQKKMKNNDP